VWHRQLRLTDRNAAACEPRDEGDVGKGKRIRQCATLVVLTYFAVLLAVRLVHWAHRSRRSSRALTDDRARRTGGRLRERAGGNGRPELGDDPGSNQKRQVTAAERHDITRLACSRLTGFLDARDT
jgi:hypothetical protein